MTDPLIQESSESAPLWRSPLHILGLPFRRKRWIWVSIALLVTPWLWITLFEPEPGTVNLPLLTNGDKHQVWVVLSSYHASIVIEQPKGWALGQPEYPTSEFVEYAWGDRRFYMESNFWPHALFSAVFLPSESVAYIRSLHQSPAQRVPHARVFRRQFDTPQFKRLLISLEEGLVRTPDGHRASPYPPTADYSGRFFPARENYIFWRNCNAWTLHRLAASGIDSSPSGTVLPSQVAAELPGFEELR